MIHQSSLLKWIFRSINIVNGIIHVVLFCLNSNKDVILIMMNQKIIKFLLVGGLLSNYACADTQNKNIKDGTYEGSATGYYGDIQVSVTFDSGNITDITVTPDSDTDIMTASAVKTVTNHIQKEQSINVDVQTGATTTSNAIIDAVKDAITQAHGDVNEWNEDTTGKHISKEIEKTSDVVIVGGGLSGMTTALRLQQLGVQCILVEKSDTLGGITRYGGSYTQLYEEVDDDADEDSLSDFEKTIQWQKNDLGVVFSKELLSETNNMAEYATENTNVGELLATEVEVSGAEILTKTCAYALGDDASSIIAMNENGEIYHISADYIVIASGSDNHTLYSYNTGDMNKIFEDAGYLVVEQDNTLQTKIVLQVDEDTYVDTYYANQSVMDHGLILVDADGNRIVNEESSRTNINDSITIPSYLIMNGSTYKKWIQKIKESSYLNEESFEELTDITSGTDLENLLSNVDVSFNNLKDTIETYNVCSENEQEDSFGRVDKGYINVEEEIVCVKLSEATYDTNGGIVIDENSNVIEKDTNQSISNIFVVGSAANVSKSEEGSGNTWAFVSGKTVADQIGKAYE